MAGLLKKLYPFFRMATSGRIKVTSFSPGNKSKREAALLLYRLVAKYQDTGNFTQQGSREEILQL